MELPMFMSLKSETTNNKYLRYIDRDLDGVHGPLQFSGEKLVGPPYTKFKMEAASTIGNLVHIQSCYNNKYWTRADKNPKWIVAGANERQENEALPSCTLFEPRSIEPAGIGSKIKLYHVESRAYVQISRENECLFVSPDSQKYDVFTVIDWNAFVILPRDLAFRGDNVKYISVQENNSPPYLHFSGANPKDPKVENEVVPTGDGSVKISSTNTQKFWRRNDNKIDRTLDNWIWDDSVNDDPLNKLFWPVRVNTDDNNNVLVTLRNLGNNCICRRMATNSNDTEGCLIADQPLSEIIPQAAQLAVEELVKSRIIHVDTFHSFTYARIYSRKINVVVATGSAENRTQLPALKAISLLYKDTKASTWNTSTDDLAFAAFIQTTLKSNTPFVLDGGRIDCSGNFKGTYQWGQPHKSSTRIERRVQVVVPAMRRVKVTLLATEASCDIPFNYVKEDTDKEDTPIRQQTEVGLYTGVSLYDFNHIIEEGQLPPVAV